MSNDHPIEGPGLRSHREAERATRIVVSDLPYPGIAIFFEVLNTKHETWHSADSLTLTREQARELAAALAKASEGAP